MNTGIIVEPLSNKAGKWYEYGLPTWCIDFTPEDGTITLNKDVYVYRTAKEAKEKLTTATATLYKKGEYFIFRTYDDCTNITKHKGEAGGWINDIDLADATQ